MNAKKYLILVSAILVYLVITACGDNNTASAPQVTDYSISSHWLAVNRL
jgi:hypothetical protein